MIQDKPFPSTHIVLSYAADIESTSCWYFRLPGGLASHLIISLSLFSASVSSSLSKSDV